MSYILDALKKIENEKNKKKQANGRFSISDDLYKEQAVKGIRPRAWKIAGLIVVSLAALVIAWTVMSGSVWKSVAVINTPAPVTPVPLVQPDIPPATQIPAQPLPAPVTVPEPSTSPPPAPPAAVSKTPETVQTGEDDDSSSREVRRPNRRKPQTSPSVLATPAVSAPVDIKLSGIAWQDERAARRAVVNGFLLKEGSVVSGAKIIDIRADRVLFLSAAGQFEVKLDAVLPAGGQR